LRSFSLIHFRYFFLNDALTVLLLLSGLNLVLAVLRVGEVKQGLQLPRILAQ
jgi:hypothetical protein